MSAPRSIATTGIVLKRINFGEADRILTVITPDQGKVTLIAKGVRKEKSKLAGGIELFSISNISFIPGKKDIGTLVSSRLLTHYGEIVKDIKRTNSAYTFLTTVDSATEESPESDYYQLLLKSFSALNSIDVNLSLIEAWFYSRLLKLLGHQPNLVTDDNGYSLAEESQYVFNFDAMAFSRNPSGPFSGRHIKLMRLLSNESIERINLINDLDKTLPGASQLLQQISQSNP